MPVEIADFSIRTETSLKAAGIETIADLCTHSARSLSKKRFGQKSIKEISEYLAGIGLKLK